MTHDFGSAELAWIGDDLGMARGGRRGMARLPTPSGACETFTPSGRQGIEGLKQIVN
jgi:hypothetical protein